MEDSMLLCLFLPAVRRGSTQFEKATVHRLTVKGNSGKRFLDKRLHKMDLNYGGRNRGQKENCKEGSQEGSSKKEGS